MEYRRSGIYRSSRSQVFLKIGDLKNFTIFTEKHLCWSLFFNKVKAYNFINKRLRHRCIPVNIAKFLRTAFFIEHLWWLLLDFLQNLLKITVKKIISQESFSQKFLRNYLAAAFLKITTLQVFRSFSLSLNMSETYLEPSQTSR